MLVRITSELLPYEPERRFQRAIWFLSLDATRSFFPEMWVPIADPDEFQITLRDAIGAVDEELLFHALPGTMNAEVFSRLSHDYHPTTQALLQLWVDRVFVSGGSDRLSETLWSWIIGYLANHPEYVNNSKLLQLVNAIHERQLELTHARDRRIEAIGEKSSSWDKRFAPVLKPEAVLVKLRLISSYNNFVCAWEELCSELSIEELQSIFELGVSVGQSNRMFINGTPYPGSWRFELLPLLSTCAKPA